MTSPTDDVDPAAAQSIQEFADCLRRVRARADNISYRDLEQWGQRHRTPLPRSTLVDVLAARRLPRKQLLLAFLAACGVNPNTDQRWLRTWNRLAENQATPGAATARRPAHRNAGSRPGSPTAANPNSTVTRRPDATARHPRAAVLAEIAQLRADAQREIDDLRTQAAREIHGRRLRAEVAADVRAAGLRRIGTNYLNELPWGQLLADVTELDIFVAYGQTWRNVHARDLRLLAQQPDRQIRVFLPDTDDEATVAVLAARFSSTPAELISRIEATRQAYLQMRHPDGARIEVYYRRGDRLFSFYRLDQTAVVGFYSHSATRGAAVPVFVCEAPGDLYQFITDELRTIEAQSRPT